MKIQLNHLQFRAFHGLYPEEKVQGNDFEVNVVMEFTPTSTRITHIEETIDYAHIYTLIKQRMQQPEDLLETVCMDLCHLILEASPLLDMVEVSIAKLHPPIQDFIGSVAVSYVLKKNAVQ